MNKILIVEDDDTIRNSIADFLKSSGYLVDSVGDGALALEMLKKQTPDLLILDLTLPKITGETVCRESKKLHPELPVIILTAKNQTKDIIQGFNLGADDYISKPFELDELIARIKAKLKNIEKEKLEIADLTLDTTSIKVIRNGIEINLSPHEFKLLHYLLINKNKVITREMILNRVWEYSYDVDSRVVDVYIGYLRKKIDSGYDKKLISSVRGFGYVIKE